MIARQIVLSVSLCLILSSGAQADIVNYPVDNSSFELPNLASGAFDEDVDDWINNGLLSGVINENYGSPASFVPDAPDGDQWLYLDARSGFGGPGFAFQNISTINEKFIYTIDVVVGDRGGPTEPFPAYRAGFFTDDDGDFGVTGPPTFDVDGIIATFDETDFMPAAGGTIDATLSWNAAGSGLGGDDLYVGFYIPTSSGAVISQVLFDNVQVSSIPEPSSLILVGLVIGAIGYRHRRSAQEQVTSC